MLAASAEKKRWDKRQVSLIEPCAQLGAQV
jgi:hypothetical protein